MTDVNKYLYSIVENQEKRIKNIISPSGKELLSRNMYVLLESHINKFLFNNQAPRWFIISGLRGVGKTILIAQITNLLLKKKHNVLYVSVDDLIVNCGEKMLLPLIETYVKQLGSSIEDLSAPTFIFLDEVQYENDWSLILKTVQARNPQIFFMCTGSSALEFNYSANESRRSITEKLYPLRFHEFITLKKGLTPIPKLSQNLADAIFGQYAVSESYQMLKNQYVNLLSYKRRFDDSDIEEYIRFGTLPYLLNNDNEYSKLENVLQTLKKVTEDDIAKFNKDERFDPTIGMKLLYTLADSDKTSLEDLSKRLQIPKSTVEYILSLYVNAEIIFKINALGSHKSQVANNPKYLFTSPAFRLALCHNTDSPRQYKDIRPKMLEDIVALSLYRILGTKDAVTINHDNEAGGSADLIVTKLEKKIAIEVGTTEKDFRQVELSIERHKCVMGLVIYDGELTMNNECNSIKLPLSSFLLL
jgi:predicted AAA+ superfamily ATPase